MNSAWIFRLVELSRRLWVRAVLYALASIGAALIAALIAPWIGIERVQWLDTGAVKDLLTILSSTMLAVATFSLSIMVAAYAGASSHATPRVTALLLEDTTSQRALCSFVGAFIFGIVGLVALSTDIYDDAGRAVLFGVSLLVIGIVVATMLHWIDHLSRFGFMRDTLERVETATWEALEDRVRNPYLGGKRSTGIPDGAHPIPAVEVGYLLAVDMAQLNELAREKNIDVFVDALPGCFVGAGRPLAHVSAPLTKEDAEAFAEAFVIGRSRTFRQDPRFGFVVFAEIAARALSPAVNDPGTAIQVAHAGARIFTRWCRLREETSVPAVEFAHVWVPEVKVADTFEDLFRPMARDGAAMIEVGLRLQKTFALCASLPDREFQAAARAHAAAALARAEDALTYPADREALRAAHAEVAA
jgi:uncharacterized membrane protein